MTDREAMQQALEALEQHSAIQHPQQRHYRDAAIDALRERLAQTEQEPVAWLHRDSWGTLKLSQTMPPPVGAFPVYTAPQQEPVIDKSAAIRIATVLGWVPPSDTSQERKRWHKAGARAIRMAINIEREACAKVCDELAARDKLSNYYAVAAKAIRARGQG